MKIEITAEDIENGKKQSVFACPVALAMCRALRIYPFEHSISVYSEDIVFCHDDTSKILLPSQVTDIIDKYDSNQGMNPFSFELEIPKFWFDPDSWYGQEIEE